MRIVAVVIAALLTLAFAAFAAQKAAEPVIANGISAARSPSFASASAAPGGHIRVASRLVAEMSDVTSVSRAASATRSDLPTQLAQSTYRNICTDATCERRLSYNRHRSTQ